MVPSGTLLSTPRKRALPDVPAWEQVETTLADLARTRTPFSTTTSAENRITQYDPDQRLLLETDNGPAWLDIGDIRACWATFERLGRICRDDVLEPGRRGAFMMALFAQVRGVGPDPRDEACLVFVKPPTE